MAVAIKNPTSPTDSGGAIERVRVDWTRRSSVLAVLGASLFLVGMWRVDGVMAAMGLAAGALLLMAWILGRKNLGGLDLVYRGPRRVVAGKGFQARLSLQNNRSLLDAFRIDFGVDYSGGGGLARRVAWLESGGMTEVESRMILPSRGLTFVQKGWLGSVFPLGLFAFRKELEIRGEVGVLPRSRVPKELRPSGHLLDGPSLGGAGVFSGIGEWKGLREWRGGDPVRRIAWTASLKSEAAGGGLLVREDEPPGSRAEGCMLIFHSFGGDGSLIRPDRFEKALELVSGTAGLLQSWSMRIRWTADFEGWEIREIRSRRDLAQLKENLMRAQRVGWTEAHDFTAAISQVRNDESVIVISDMPRASWEQTVGRPAQESVFVDISKYDGSSRRVGP